LGGATVVGTTKVATAAAKVAAKSSLAWLKWALPVAIVSSASVGTYVWTARRHVAPMATAHVVEATPQENTAPTTVAPSIDPALQPTALSTEPGATHPSKPQPVAKPAADDLGQQLSLLHQALAEWRSGNAARALELSREHAHRYPNSQLRFERNALEVRSLCALGREAEARKIADQLRSQAPNSPVSAALKDTCVGK
jgi:hypothetical protein